MECSCKLIYPDTETPQKQTKPWYQLLTLICMKLLSSLTKCSADLGFLYCAGLGSGRVSFQLRV